MPIVDDRLSELAEKFTVTLGFDTAFRDNLTIAGASTPVSIAESDPIRVDVVGPLAVSEGGTATYHALLSPSGGIPSAGADCRLHHGRRRRHRRCGLHRHLGRPDFGPRPTTGPSRRR